MALTTFPRRSRSAVDLVEMVGTLPTSPDPMRHKRHKFARLNINKVKLAAFSTLGLLHPIAGVD